MDELLENLKKRLLLSLPGKEVQFLMAPSYRSEKEGTVSKHLAGVIILLYLKNNQLHFPLIERPIYNGVHSGQISFPGGRMEECDRNLTITALRECEEEIGIASSDVLVLGSLTSLFIPVSNFEVYPTVALLKKDPVFIPQIAEVVSIIEVPVDLILSGHIKDQKTIEYNGNQEIIPSYNIRNKMVWGATAMILSEFSQVLKESGKDYSDTRFL
jgi:8-oxo-dGTP pyrophosphatase MutT (NUDIX family)